jgi:hypothetical protein
MKWLILLALFSCSTKKPETVAAPVETESNAKPVSPYTVKPCYCMKIFQPVCADGQSYGNSCEAECHGNKTWKEGSCADQSKKK